MKLSKILLVGLTSTALSFGLAACSTTGKNKNMSNAPVSDESGGANAAGLGSQGGFGGSNMAAKLRAPANQSYYFNFNKDDVHQGDYASIAAQAKYVSTHSTAHLRLEGNTDNRGSREYNMALGWRRAKAVSSILQQDGVAPNQLTLVSYGAEKPVALGNTESAYQQNRRVDLKYTAK